MANRSGRNTPRAGARRDPFDVAINDLHSVLRRTRVWKPADLEAIIRAVTVICKWAFVCGDVLPEFIGAVNNRNKLITDCLAELYPHLAREIISLDFRGVTPGRVTLSKLQECAEWIRSTIDTLGLDPARNLNIETLFFQQALSDLLIPTMEFIHTVAFNSDAVKKDAVLRHTVINIMQYIFLATGPGDTYIVLRAYPPVYAVVTRLIDAVDREEHGFLRISIPAWRCIAAWASELMGERVFAIELDKSPLTNELEALTLAFMRAAMRTNISPAAEAFLRDDGARSAGLNFIESLGLWALIHSYCLKVHQNMTAEHYAVFPFVLEWCTDPTVFAARPESCLQILYVFCTGLALEEKHVAFMSADHAVRVLRLATSVMNNTSQREHCRSYAELILKVLLHYGIPHNAEFLEVLDCPQVMEILETTILTFKAQEVKPQLASWALVALSMQPRMLARFLSPGISTAQVLLDFAILLPSDPYYNREHREPTRHDIALIHFVILIAVRFEGVSYEVLRTHASSIITSFYLHPAGIPTVAMFSHIVGVSGFFLGLDNDCNEKGRGVVQKILETFSHGDIQFSGPENRERIPSFIRRIPWDEEGWQLRRQFLDLCMRSFPEPAFDDPDSSNRVKRITAGMWCYTMILNAPFVRRAACVELLAQMIYVALLESPRIVTDLRQHSGDYFPALSFGLAVRASNLLSNAPDLITPRAREFIYLSLWLYCGLYLDDEPPTSELEEYRTTWLALCQGVLEQPKRAHESDARTREAASEVARLLSGRVGSS